MPFLFVINIYGNKNRERNNMAKMIKCETTKGKRTKIKHRRFNPNTNRDFRNSKIQGIYPIKGMYEAIGLNFTKLERRKAS